MPHCSRRSLLGILGTGLSVSLAGCSFGSGDESSPLRIGFKNFTDSEQEIDVEAVRSDGEDLGESRFLNTVYTIPVTSGGDGAPIIKEEIESRRYIIRADLFATAATDAHYHFIPDCIGDDVKDMILITIFRDDFNDLDVRFTQQRC